MYAAIGEAETCKCAQKHLQFPGGWDLKCGLTVGVSKKLKMPGADAGHYSPPITTISIYDRLPFYIIEKKVYKMGMFLATCQSNAWFS